MGSKEKIKIAYIESQMEPNDSDVNEQLRKLGNAPCIIREIFEFGLKLKKEIGEDKVYDFSLGNPNIPAPKGINKTIKSFLDTKEDDFLYGYTSANGDEKFRKAIVDNINERFRKSNRKYEKDDIFITCGASAALSFLLTALTAKQKDEIIFLAPYFPEYITFSTGGGAKIKICPADTQNFQINFEELEKLITENTKVIIVNSPNNPTGVVYSEETIKKLSDLLNKKQEEFNKAIYIVSDEPYRELIYDNIMYPFTANYYKNTIICYSYSKSMSIPGERIGYILVTKDIKSHNAIMSAIAGAARIYGHACGPSLMQKVITENICNFSDIKEYENNKNDLYNGLVNLGYTCIKPQGAFYIFMKALGENSLDFCKVAREKYNILIVPSDPFGCPGYVRIAFCVKNDMIKRSMPAFEKLKKYYEREG